MNSPRYDCPECGNHNQDAFTHDASPTLAGVMPYTRCDACGYEDERVLMTAAPLTSAQPRVRTALQAYSTPGVPFSRVRNFIATTQSRC